MFGNLLSFGASVVLVAASATATAADHVAGPVAAEVVRVIDGDTIAVRAHIWPGHVVEMPIRVAGIDSPERKGGCAGERALAEQAEALLRVVLVAGRATLTDITFDKYGGRARAHVTTEDGDVGEALVRAGLARAYAGGKRPDWCE